jgi:two-component system, OmpR family, sensor histidine kinase CiaH
MRRPRPDSPLWAAARVAAVATLIAALLYAVAALGIVVLVNNNLTQQLDQNVAAELKALRARPLLALDRAQGRPSSDQGQREAINQTTIWIVSPDGQVLAAPTAPALPSQYVHVQSPTPARIQGHSLRLAGGPLGNGWLIVGASADYIDYATRALLVEAVVVGVPLMALVFLAALAIGRWSAAPVDRARRRLLEFTADASHELRTPLQVIEAEVSLALLQERGASSYRETIQNIGGESKRLHRLVDDLLWLARFDTLPGGPRSEVVDMAELATDAVERFRVLAEQRRLRLTLQNDAARQGLVLAPPEWIDRLLGVLIDNACRYTPEGGMVRVAVESRDGQVTLRVEDSGPGIPPGERQRIFERFHRLGNDGRGSGLGLSIAGAVVQATRGRWRVGESPEGGASLAVSWPAARGPREQIETEMPSPLRGGLGGGTS